MRTDIARLELHNRRRLIVGYVIGMAIYMLVVVALYPAFKHSTELDHFSRDNATVAALFGLKGSLTSPAGWIDTNAYTNFFPLIALLLSIGYGAATIAGQDDDGTLSLLTTLPRARRAILLGKIAALAAMTVLLASVVAACVYAGAAFDINLDAGHVATATLAVTLLGLDLGLVSLAIGAATGNRGTAVGLTSAFAATSYLLSSLAPVVSWLHPFRYASLFYWAVGHQQLSVGAGVGSLAVLLAVAAVAAAAATRAFDRLDLH